MIAGFDVYGTTNRSLIVINQLFHLTDEDSGANKKEQETVQLDAQRLQHITCSAVKLHDFLHYIFLHFCSQFGIHRQSDGLFGRFLRFRARKI